MLFLLFFILLVVVSLIYVGFHASRAPEGSEEGAGFRVGPVNGCKKTQPKYLSPKRSALLPSVKKDRR